MYRCISTAMLVHITPGSGVPLYMQIEMQLKHAVAAGALKQGDALPSIRTLAVQLRINPNTVARAYQSLEQEGTITTIPGAGTYVADSDRGLLKAEKVRRMRPHAKQLAVEGTQLRLEPEEVLQLVRDELDKLGGKE